MKRNIFAVLLALVSCVTISMAQPSRGGESDANRGGNRGVRVHQSRPATEQNIQVMAAKRVAALKVQLSLDENQERQVSQIVSKFYTSRPAKDVIPTDATKEQRQKARAEMNCTRVQMNSDIKSILSDEQKAKYDELLASKRGGRGSQR